MEEGNPPRAASDPAPVTADPAPPPRVRPLCRLLPPSTEAVDLDPAAVEEDEHRHFGSDSDGAMEQLRGSWRPLSDVVLLRAAPQDHGQEHVSLASLPSAVCRCSCCL